MDAVILRCATSYFLKSEMKIQDVLNILIITPIVTTMSTDEKWIVLMRGASGSGKSYLANQISIKHRNARRTVVTCSADAYFNGVFDKSKLQDAHDSCKENVEAAMKKGILTIIVDNTNIKIVELMPYIVLAVKYGYKVNQSKTTTAWNHSIDELFRKSVHNVPLDTIRWQLKTFEHISVSQLTQIVNDVDQSLKQVE